MLALVIEMLPAQLLEHLNVAFCYMHGENLPSLAAHGGRGHFRNAIYQIVRGTDTGDLVGCRGVLRHPPCRGSSLNRLRKRPRSPLGPRSGNFLGVES